jgi:hypothetical protein
MVENDLGKAKSLVTDQMHPMGASTWVLAQARRSSSSGSESSRRAPCQQ